MKRLCSSLLLAAGLSALPHTWADDAPAGEAGEKPVWTFTAENEDWQYGTTQGVISDGNWKFRVSRTNAQYSRDFYLRSPNYNSESNKSGTYLEGSGSILDFSTLERWDIGGSEKYLPGGVHYCGLINMNSVPGTTNRADQAEIDAKFRGDIKKIVFPAILKGGDGGTLPNWFNCFQKTTAPFPNVEEVDFSLCTELTALPSRFFYRCPELKTIRLPATVMSVDKQGVFDASNLTAIYWDGPAPDFTGGADIGYLWNKANNTTNYVSRQYAESWKALCDDAYPLGEGMVGQLKVDYAGRGDYAIPKKVYVAFADEGGFALTLEDWTGPYDGEPHGPVFSVNPPDATVTWAVGESQDYSDEMPTLTEVGSLSVRARAEKEGEDPIEKSATITVTIGENSWIIEPSLSKRSWKVGEEAPTLTLGQPKFGTPTANYTQATLPTAVGNYVLEVTVPASDNYTALVKNIPFAIVDKSTWTFEPMGADVGQISDGNWTFWVHRRSSTSTEWRLEDANNAGGYLAGAGDLDMSALQPWEGCTTLKIEAAPTAAEGVENKFTDVVTKLVFPSFLGENTPPQWCRNSGDNKSYCPNVTEVDFSRCENVTALPMMFTQGHAKLTTLRLPATLSSVPQNSTFTGPALNAIYWNGPVPTFTGGSGFGTFWNKKDFTTNYVLRANAESWKALCDENYPLDEKKVGQLKNDYKGMYSGHYELVYVVFTPFKEKKGMMVIIR